MAILHRHLTSLLALATALAPTATFAGTLPSLLAAPTNLTWQLLPTGTTAQLRGLSAYSERLLWTSGTQGTVLRSTDGGASWKAVSPLAGAPPVDREFIDFVAVAATSADYAALLALGDGPLFITRDGGASWTSEFANDLAEAFFECIAFSAAVGDGASSGNGGERTRGVALSDPVATGPPQAPYGLMDYKFLVMGTLDGGRTWETLSGAGMPLAQQQETAFAASGSCVTTAFDGRMFFGTGGAATARVFRSGDGGRTWSVSATPVASGNAKGVFSVQFGDGLRGVAVGGDYKMQNETRRIAAYSTDGGVTWKLPDAPPGGYRSAAAWVPGTDTVIAVGPTGTDVSTDAGRNWQTFDKKNGFDAIACPSSRMCYASGEGGRVGRLIVG